MQQKSKNFCKFKKYEKNMFLIQKKLKETSKVPTKSTTM